MNVSIINNPMIHKSEKKVKPSIYVSVTGCDYFKEIIKTPNDFIIMNRFHTVQRCVINEI